MKFTGIITEALPVASGTSQNGNAWRRAEYELTYDNSRPEYPKAVLFSVMNDNIEKLNLQKGSSYEVELDFSVREHEGRRYMSATGWKATPVTAQ